MHTKTESLRTQELEVMATLTLRKLRRIKYGERLDPYEDVLESIDDRMTEIKSMTKPKAEFDNFMDKINPDIKEKIKSIGEMDLQVLRKKRRAVWDFKAKLFHAIKMVLMMVRACKPRRKYFRGEKTETALAVKRLKERENANELKENLKSSLSLEMQLSLTLQPRYRNNEDLKRIVWILRATKAFKQLFPTEVETDIARCVAYERYDPGRILALQGREPDRFYYVITGKIQKLQEYRLSSGIVTKSMGYMAKGSTSDTDELENKWPLEYNLVAKGQVEVLYLHKSDFLRLRNRTLDPSIDFLRTLDLFLEFPCEVFKTNPESVNLKYYGEDVKIVEDTNRTPWIHVVKSGRVKVVRMQNVIDVDTNDRKFKARKLEDLGCGRSFSHASAMMGSLLSQRKMKELSGNTFTLAETESFEGNNEGFSNPHYQSLLVKKTSVADGLKLLGDITRRHKNPKPPSEASHRQSGHPQPFVSRNNTNELAPPGVVNGGKSTPIVYVKPPIVVEPGVDDPRSGRGSRADTMSDIPLPTLSEQLPVMTSQETQTNKKKISLPPISKSLGSDRRPSTISSELRPHGTYLTREMTDYDPVYKNKGKQQEIRFRPARIQLDVLCPGDIFGLDSVSQTFHAKINSDSGAKKGLEHLHLPTASEPKGVTLISDGAEVIEINKRFFLEHAQNNTMLRVETMQREYMDTDEARDVLYTKETWDQYRSVLMKRMVAKLNHR